MAKAAVGWSDCQEEREREREGWRNSRTKVLEGTTC